MKANIKEKRVHMPSLFITLPNQVERASTQSISAGRNISCLHDAAVRPTRSPLVADA